MKAIVQTKYGSPDVLRLEDVEKPAPKDDEVLVKDPCGLRECLRLAFPDRGHIPDPLYGRGIPQTQNTRPGADLAGTVEAVGKNVTQFKPGDEVFGDIGHGAFAEYACAAEKRLVLKPVNLTFEEAAAVPMAALTALQGLRDEGKIQAGQKVLINGASGGVGTFAVQVAKSFGAEVTAVCSTHNLEQARSPGCGPRDRLHQRRLHQKWAAV